MTCPYCHYLIVPVSTRASFAISGTSTAEVREMRRRVACSNCHAQLEITVRSLAGPSAEWVKSPRINQREAAVSYCQVCGKTASVRELYRPKSSDDVVCCRECGDRSGLELKPLIAPRPLPPATPPLSST